MTKHTTFRFPTVDTVLSYLTIAGVAATGVVCLVATNVPGVTA